MSTDTGDALPFKIVDFDALPSTQDEARRRLEAGEDVHGLVVRAARQSAARGQRARDWSAGLGGSYQTLIVREVGLRGPSQPQAAVVLALGLAQTLQRYGVQVGLKWPNDLYYRGKKLAGVLVEGVRGHLLVGVGLNVANEVPEGAVGLRGWDVEGAHMVVLEGLQSGLIHLADPNFRLPDAYAPFDLLLGQALELQVGKVVQAGTGAGVDAQGRLRVQQQGGVTSYAGGRLRRFSLRAAPAPLGRSER